MSSSFVAPAPHCGAGSKDVNPMPAGIRVKDNESFEGALRRFKKKCEKAGILSEVRRHQYFEKPSDRRKRKLNAARRKAAKNAAMES